MLTVVDPPLSPPPLSTPAGAERGANSPMWPCLFTRDVHGHGQHVHGNSQYVHGNGQHRFGGAVDLSQANGWLRSDFGQLNNGTRSDSGARGGAGNSNSDSNNATPSPRASQGFTQWFNPNQRSRSQTSHHQLHPAAAHKAKRRVRPHSKHWATYGCWLPFPPRRGWKGAGGIGGETTSVSNRLCAARRNTSCL